MPIDAPDTGSGGASADHHVLQMSIGVLLVLVAASLWLTGRRRITQV